MATETTTTTAPGTTASSGTIADEAQVPFTQDERLSRADAIIRRNVLWSFGAGVLPIPIFDLLASTAVQIKMIKELSNLYGVTFREHIVKKLVISLLSSVAGVAAGTAVAISLGKLIPGVGAVLGAALAPVTVGAITYATGNVFVMHFEAGGTLLDFDARAMRAHFKSEFEKGKIEVTRLFEDDRRSSTTVTPPPTVRRP